MPRAASPASTANGDRSAALARRVRDAAETRTPLRIAGGDSKAFYGRRARGARLDVSTHRGIVSYEPSELVLTARGGTPLAEVEAALAERGQMLPFEPPHFGAGATLGGSVACGLAGPRRPYAGAVRDFVLGVRVLNGRGEVLGFGGRVMKNVAGYDVSRLMAGAMGTLGVLLEISLKVLPAPEAERTLRMECDAAEALARLGELGARPLPISAACHDGERLHLRLSGTRGAVESARAALGGEAGDGGDFWRSLREHSHPFFGGDAPLWRVAVPPGVPAQAIPDTGLIEWGGGQRWVRTAEGGAALREAAVRAGGHAALFRHGDRGGEVFQPLPAALHALHRRLKQAFDPRGVLNPGRMYADL